MIDDNYLQFLIKFFEKECGQRRYMVNSSYDEIEVVRGEKYYVYNQKTSIFLGYYGKELLKKCSPIIYEKDLIALMKEEFDECEENELLVQIYFNLAQLIHNKFIVCSIEQE